MTKSEKITDFLTGIKIENLSIMDYINSDDVNNFDDIYELINNNGGFEIEIIYYDRAIDYLMENDPSLTQSLELAKEYFHDISGLNSEILATLLASQKCREDFQELESEINEFFNELNYEFN